MASRTASKAPKRKKNEDMGANRALKKPRVINRDAIAAISARLALKSSRILRALENPVAGPEGLEIETVPVAPPAFSPGALKMGEPAEPEPTDPIKRASRAQPGHAQPGIAPADIPKWAQWTVTLSCVISAAGVLWLGERIKAVHPLIGEEVPRYVDAALPFFILLMIIEYFVLKTVRVNSPGAEYTLADTWSSIGAGLVQQMTSKLIPLFARYFLATAAYVNVFNATREHHFAFFGGKIGLAAYNRPLVFAFAFLSIDFTYYVYHRAMHTSAFLWVGHSVHHSSEHFNLSTALRQSTWQGLVGYVPYLYLAAIGLPPHVYLAHKDINLLYQFWVHTCVVRRLHPALEFLLSTPSHHRVHHDRRVHKNFGAILIVWDRIFGSFCDEHAATPASDVDRSETCLFGVRLSLQSWYYSVFQTRHWRLLFSRLGKVGLGRPALLAKTAIKGPGFDTVTMDRPIRAPAEKAPRLRLISRLNSRNGRLYTSVHFIAAIIAGVLVLLLPAQCPEPCVEGAIGIDCRRECALNPVAYWRNMLLFTQCMCAFYVQSKIFDADNSAIRMEIVRCVVTALLYAAVAAVAAYSDASLPAIGVAVTFAVFHAGSVGVLVQSGSNLLKGTAKIE